MGSFNFQWAHPAKEVFVTGTFDDWGKTIKLEKKGNVFEKEVDVPASSEAVFYKFVVDGEWTTDHTAPQENDGHNNINNVLYTKNLKPKGSGFVPMSTVTPASTTAKLAKDVPKTTKGAAAPDPSGMPGDFPETPQQETKEFSVKPIPATAGTGNPVSLKPGEKVPDPSSITSNTVNSTATTDKASYDKGPSVVGMATPKLPNPVTPQVERDQKGYGILDVPPVTGSTIPESSLPIGTGPTGAQDAGPHISSAAPQSTTATLASQVPKEPRKAATQVPEVVRESQTEAKSSPEASGSNAAVQEKKQVEAELKKEIPKEPSAAEGTSRAGGLGTTDKKEDDGLDLGKAAGIAAGAAATAGGVAYATATSAKDKVVDTANTSSVVPESVKQSINQMNTDSNKNTTASGVPTVVSDSINQAHQTPEAAGNREAVGEKKDVENELLSEIKPAQQTGESAPSIGATTATKDTPGTATLGAATSSTAASGLAAPAAAPAQTQTATPDSRDVSPMSRGPTTQPMVTSGVSENKTDRVSGPATPSKNDPSSAASSSPATADSSSKKDKRRSGFFGKIKEKLKH